MPKAFTTKAGSEDVPGLPGQSWERSHSRALLSMRSPRRGSSRSMPIDAVDLYLHEIRSYPTLSKDEEACLGQAIEAGRVASDELGHRRRRSLERSRRLEDQMTKGRQARDEFIRANLRLVVSVAKGYRYTAMPLADLIGCGNLGLLSAVEKFEWQRGYRFSTYASCWIRQAIVRWVQTDRRVVHLPVHVGAALGQLRRTQRQLEVELQRTPSRAELARAVGLSTDRVVELLGYEVEPASLSQPREGTNQALSDAVADPATGAAFEEALASTFRAEVGQMLGVLTPREQTVLRLRFGMSGNRPHTREEIGRHLGLTRERARQIEVEAIGKLRHPAVGADRWRELIAS
jgi:RNA polymerase primary sigma factor